MLLRTSTHPKVDSGLDGFLTRRIREAAVRAIGATSGRVLDVGCGTGLFLETLAPAVPCVGVDVSQARLEVAARACGDQVRLVAGDALRLPFKPGVFESIVCLNTLLNVPEPAGVQNILRELRRICGGDSRLLVDVRNRRNPLMRVRYRLSLGQGIPTVAYDVATFSAMLGEARFRVTAREPVGLLGGRWPLAFLVEARPA